MFLHSSWMVLITSFRKKKWAKSCKMDSHFNSTEKLLPLLHPHKRVTTHQLEKSLRRMGFRSWKSFLPGIFGTVRTSLQFFYFQTTAWKIYFSAWIILHQNKKKTAKFHFLQILKCNVTNISCLEKKAERKENCTYSSRFFSFKTKYQSFKFIPSIHIWMPCIRYRCFELHHLDTFS